MTDALHDRVVAAIGDRYLLEEEIGRGGSAVVYRATDIRLNRSVAIKVLPPELAYNPDVRTRFLREAQTAAQLNHYNIVPIYSVDERGGIVHFVMALIEGESLGEMLARDGAWAFEPAVKLLGEVADALDYAHRHGVVHRDVKPDNILIEKRSGRALVTDFGIARAAAGETRLTATGVAVGTPTYMSPEQAIGEREVDGRSDVYSLGVLAYQLLTGAPPFAATSAPAMLVKHVSERPVPVRERRPAIPASLAMVIDRAMAKSPDDRWATAGELRDALASAMSSAHVREPEPQLAPHSRLPRGPLVPEPEERERRHRHDYFLPAPPAPPDAVARLSQGSRWGTAMAIGSGDDDYDERPLYERVIKFRRASVRFILLAPTFLIMNAATEGVPWFLIPSGFLLFDMLRKGGSIWSDGVGPLEAFRKGIRLRLRGELPAAAPREPERPRQLPVRRREKTPPPTPTAAPELLEGPHGLVVRRAAADRAVIRDILTRLGPIEKDLLPDVAPTAEALAERVASIAVMLHRLEIDISGTTIESLDERLESMGREPESTDRERRLALLERQRSSLQDLAERRRVLANQLESASLALQTLKLDLLKLRSAGVSASLMDQSSATQEARSISKDIGRAIEVADELRKIGG